MAQLLFKYGTMNSGKSIELLKVAHNYEEGGKTVILLTSALDTRDGVGTISSRIGLSEQAIAISPDTNVVEKLATPDLLGANCILVDEAQFLTVKQVEGLASMVDIFDIPVICYGLKNDFSNHLFEGSRALLLIADKLEEIKTVCRFCDKKATMNLRTVDGKPVYNGDQVQIGDSEYLSVCRKHWNNPEL